MARQSRLRAPAPPGILWSTGAHAMEWLRKREREEPAAFWKGVEERRGGPVTFSTFATFVGTAGSGRRDLPGLLYVANATAWFEDFEKDNWLYRIVGANRKYEKTELSFPLAEVAEVRFVGKARVDRCLAGAVPPAAVPPVARIMQIFAAPLVLVLLKDGGGMVFDLLERRKFAALFAPAPAGAPGV